MTRTWPWYWKSKENQNWNLRIEFYISHCCIELLSFDCESPTSTTKSRSHPSDAVRLHLSREMFSTQLTQNDAVAIKDADTATIAVHDLSPKKFKSVQSHWMSLGWRVPPCSERIAFAVYSHVLSNCHRVSIKALSLSAIFSTESQGSEMAWTSFTFSFSIFWNTTSLKLAPVGHAIWHPGRTKQWHKSGWIIRSGL